MDKSDRRRKAERRRIASVTTAYHMPTVSDALRVIDKPDHYYNQGTIPPNISKTLHWHVTVSN